jgi:type IV secretion system protein VirD4
VSNALGPAQLFGPPRRRWPAALTVLLVAIAIACAASGSWTGAIFCALLALPFAATWLRPALQDRGDRSPAEVLLDGLLDNRFWPRWSGLLLLAVLAASSAPNAAATNILGWIVVLLIPARLLYKHPGILHGRLPTRRSSADRGRLPATVAQLHAHMAALGGGCYLAMTATGQLLAAPAAAAVLILAGPRKGKSACVVAPAIAAHPGPVVSTSTKLELLDQTLAIRAQRGTCWYADLAAEGIPAGCQPLRYSPLQRADDWDRAMLVADAMVRAGEGAAHDKPHWKERAGALLACCLHAAAISEGTMRDVVSWVMRHDPDTPLALLDQASIAHDVLYGIAHTDREERSGIFSTAARVLQAYRSESALALADQPNFDPDAFATSTDTLYIAAPGERQRLLAPLVVALLVEIRQARYHAHRHGHTDQVPLLMALDEARNIAPIHDLPQQLSEGGGQGIQTMVVLQSLSQARAVWHEEGESLMDFTDAVVILGGVTDKTTCETVSRRAGHWDRPIQTVTEQHATHPLIAPTRPTRSEGWTTHREARIPPDQVANIPFGQALVMIGTNWQYLPALPYHQHPCFTQVLADAHQLSHAAPSPPPTAL